MSPLCGFANDRGWIATIRPRSLRLGGESGSGSETVPVPVPVPGS